MEFIVFALYTLFFPVILLGAIVIWLLSYLLVPIVIIGGAFGAFFLISGPFILWQKTEAKPYSQEYQDAAILDVGMRATKAEILAGFQRKACRRPPDDVDHFAAIRDRMLKNAKS